MIKEMLEGLKVAFGAVAAVISVGGTIAGLSITTIATALFWATIAFAVVITLTVTVSLPVMTYRNPDIPASAGLKATIRVSFLCLLGTSVLFNAGFKDTDHFHLTQIVGIVLLSAALAIGAAIWVSSWKDAHKRCGNCNRWVVAEAVGCRHCLASLPRGRWQRR